MNTAPADCLVLLPATSSSNVLFVSSNVTKVLLNAFTVAPVEVIIISPGGGTLNDVSKASSGILNPPEPSGSDT